MNIKEYQKELPGIGIGISPYEKCKCGRKKKRMVATTRICKKCGYEIYSYQKVFNLLKNRKEEGK